MTDVPVDAVDEDPPQEMGVPHFPRFDAGELRATAHLWRTVAGGLRSTMDTTHLQVNGAGAVWTGEAHAAFAAEWTTLAGNVQQLSTELDGVALHLDQLVDELEEQERQFKMLLAEIGLSIAVGVGLSFVTFGGAAVISTVKAATTIRRLYLVIEAVGNAAARFALRAAGGSLRAMVTRFVVNAGFYGGTQVVGNVITDPGGNPFRDISPADLTLAAAIGVFLPFHGKGHVVFRGAANNVTTEALIGLYRNHELDPGSLALAGVVGGAGGKITHAIASRKPGVVDKSGAAGSGQRSAATGDAVPLVGRKSEPIDLADDRIRKLGMEPKDPLEKQLREFADEARTAVRTERKLGVTLHRVDSGFVEWVDDAGVTYDAIGSGLRSEFFNRQWENGNLPRQIFIHVDKADRVPFDVELLKPDQIAVLKRFLEENKERLGGRVFLVGE